MAHTLPAITTTSLVSKTLSRQLGNAFSAIREQGYSHRQADDIMRETLMAYLADRAVCAIDGADAEYARACIALDDAFLQRGHRASTNPAEPAAQIKPGFDWIVCGYDLRKLAVGIVAVLALLIGASGR